MPAQRLQSQANLDDPRATDTFIASLTQALQFATLHHTYLSTYKSEFQDARKQATKYRGAWLAKFDLDEIVRAEAHKNLHLHSLSPDYETPLTELLTQEALKEIAARVVAFVKTVPRSYDVLFPLPRVLIKDSVQLAPRVSIFRTHPSETNTLRGIAAGVGLLGSIGKPKGDTCYLSVQTTGYVSSSLGQSAMHDALSLIKRVLQIADVIGLTETESYRGESNDILVRALGGSPSATPADAYAQDNADKDSLAAKIQLPIGTSTHLTKLALDDSRARAGRKIRPESREQDLATHLRCGAFLVTDDAQLEETKTLRSALEWTFDAVADEDPTGSFIKTCVALEAALSDGLDKEQITQRLGDRCAYLLGDRTSTRRRIKSQFDKIYKLRSELVHGDKTRIQGEEDETTAFLGTQYRDLILRREIERLEAWATKSGALPT